VRSKVGIIDNLPPETVERLGKLAADLAEFYDQSPEEVLSILLRAVEVETRPIRESGDL
jgi:hypothetical protein